jgi:GNAT superfamily N-acetyltransferase
MVEVMEHGVVMVDAVEWVGEVELVGDVELVGEVEEYFVRGVILVVLVQHRRLGWGSSLLSSSALAYAQRSEQRPFCRLALARMFLGKGVVML